MTDIAIRALQTMDEMRQFAAAEHAIWQMSPTLTPYPEPELLLTVAHNGGLVLGAWDGDTLAGILFGFLGRAADGQIKHCSHIMGVRPAYRGEGVAAALKWAQRAQVRAAGLRLVTWTYDPLETPNARLNLHTLGVVCNTLHPNLYGAMQDGLNAGLPSDRFEAEWRLDAPAVAARAAGEYHSPVPPPPANPPLPPLTVTSWPRPGAWALPDDPHTAVAVPTDFQGLRRADPALALEWRLHSRAVFAALFAAGYLAHDVLVQPEERILLYLLQHQPAPPTHS